MGRVAVVTGGASGIGLAIVRRLAAGGASVALLDLDAGAADRAAAELRGEGMRVIGLGADVSDRAAVEKALEAARGEFGPIEIMVTSAGLSLNAPFLEITVEDWDRVLAVNLTGTFHCLQLAVPDMIAGGWGRIVTISSSSAQSGSRTQAHYSASKGGVVVLTKTLALELGQYGITVNTIPPRAVVTPMFMAAPVRAGTRRRGAHQAAGRAEPGPSAGRARGHRRRHRLPLLRRRRLHHRPGHRRERRQLHLSRRTFR